MIKALQSTGFSYMEILTGLGSRTPAQAEAVLNSFIALDYFPIDLGKAGPVPHSVAPAEAPLPTTHAIGGVRNMKKKHSSSFFCLTMNFKRWRRSSTAG